MASSTSIGDPRLSHQIAEFAAALVQRGKTGKGVTIEVSLLDRCLVPSTRLASFIDETKKA
jgi:crotonobetainyl-CoA:carnitine CoA-transferase CaiB-like acyl-CoA transferase